MRPESVTDGQDNAAAKQRSPPHHVRTTQFKERKYSAAQVTFVKGCVSDVLFHATFDQLYLYSTLHKGRSRTLDERDVTPFREFCGGKKNEPFRRRRRFLCLCGIITTACSYRMLQQSSTVGSEVHISLCWLRETRISDSRNLL